MTNAYPSAKKLLEYAANVWDIRDDPDDARIDAKIDATHRFVENLGIKTRLGDYDVGASGIDHIVNALKDYGVTALGEHGEIKSDDARRILETA